MKTAMVLSRWVGFAILSSMSFSAYASAERPATGLVIENAWVRQVPEGVPHTAAYLKVSNPSGHEVKIVGASSSIAKAVELHTHVEKNGGMKMEQVDFVVVPAHKSVLFKPKGLHLMLFFLKPEFKSARDVSLELKLADGTKKAFTASIRGFDSPSSSTK